MGVSVLIILEEVLCNNSDARNFVQMNMLLLYYSLSYPNQYLMLAAWTGFAAFLGQYHFQI